MHAMQRGLISRVRTLPSPPNECSGLYDKWIIAHLHWRVQAKRGRDAKSERKPSSFEA